MSEPSSPVPTIGEHTSDIWKLIPLSEAFDLDKLISSEDKCDLLNSEHWRKAPSDSCEISEKAWNELKEYEQSFDKSRRWKNPVAGFSLRVRR
jgi:hypothetical protein